MSNPDKAFSLIEVGASLRDISACFDRPIDAYSFFGSVMQEHYSVETISAGCRLCGNEVTAVEAVSWRALAHNKSTGVVALLMPLIGRITKHGVEVSFTTCHSVCAGCSRRTWWRFKAAQCLKAVLFALLLLTLFVVVPVTVLAVVMPFKAPELMPKLLLLLLGSSGFGYLVFRGLQWAWSFAVPDSLRKIGKYPFEPIRIKTVGPSVAAEVSARS